MFRIRNPEDFGSAVLFVVIGGAGLWFGREYEVGTASDMGPGYFPNVLSGCLIVFGLVLGLRSLKIPGPKLEPIVWRGVFFTLGSILAYALLIESAGLAPAIFAVTALAAMASHESRWKETLAMALGMAVFCVLIFIYALRQSMTVFGS